MKIKKYFKNNSYYTPLLMSILLFTFSCSSIEKKPPYEISESYNVSINRDFWGIKLHKSMPRESLLSQLDDKGLLTKPKGMSVQEYMGYQKGRMVESKEGITTESKLGDDVTLLANSRMLEDGSYIQNFTDISDIKKHEEMPE